METKKSRSKFPIIVLVGRVNVGKSTLFNKLLGVPHSLVSAVPGTTRDTQEALVAWRGITFLLLDTGGLDAREEPTGIFSAVIARAQEAVTRADLVLLITDAHEGMLPGDLFAARTLRRYASKVITVVNKADNPTLRARAAEFARLGFGEPMALSAINGTGTGDLLDVIINRIADTGVPNSTRESAHAIRIAIIGKPNVGKSTLVNAILGFDRVIVSPHAHTTREPVDTPLIWHDTPLVLIDTAGIRRKARVERGLEQIGVRRSINVLERADIALFVIDIFHGIDDQDKQLARLIEESGVGVVLVTNKWDLVREGEQPRSRNSVSLRGMRNSSSTPIDRGAYYLKYIYGKFSFLTWAPIVFCSALNASHVQNVMEHALHVSRARNREIPHDELTKFFATFLARRPLPSLGEARKKSVLVHFIQTGTRPPSFELAIKTKERFPEPYLRLMEKEMRKQFDLDGTSIRINANTMR